MANPFFDAAYYLAQNPDVAAAGYTLATAEQHYAKYGAFEVRAANPWFDARAYLAAYPDLAAHGVTVANALAHYTTYGINENRSPAANVNPADFTYADYAANNADLRTAFGITDPAHLTVAQQHQLLAQYLSLGFHEGRTGINGTATGSFFSQPAPPVTPPVTPPTGPVPGQTIILNLPAAYTGGDGDDLFTGGSSNLIGSTLNGMGGNDTLQATITGSTPIHLTSIEHIAINLTATATVSVTGAGVTSVTLGGDPGGFFGLTYAGDKVDTFALNSRSTVNAQFTAPSVAGISDSLQINLSDSNNNAHFATSGIEHYGVAFGLGNSLLTLNAGTIGTASVDGTLTGGHADDAMSLVFSADPTALQTVTIDGSAVVGNLSVTLDPLLSSANATVSGGSGNDTLVAVADAAHNTTLNGNAGNDSLTASAGIDTMTGGTGNDTFHFLESNSSALARMAGPNIAATDVITDFTSGDQLVFSGFTAPDAADVQGVAIASILKGVITFTTGFLAAHVGDLTAIVAGIDSDLSSLRFNYVFSDGTDTYFLQGMTTPNNSPIVKLQLIGGTAVDVHLLNADSSGVHYAPSLPV
jgi:Ca2+-binding RTX toxin-like protein